MEGNSMKYNEQLEELQKFRDSIRDVQNIVESLGIQLGEFIDVIEQKRDDYESKSNMEFEDGEHLTSKGSKELEPDKMEEQIKRKRQVLAGIK